MRGSKRKGRRPGTWELRVDAGRDPLTGSRQQKSVMFEGTSREADLALAELITASRLARFPPRMEAPGPVGEGSGPDVLLRSWGTVGSCASGSDSPASWLRLRNKLVCAVS
jgi:hypothetical protein